MATKKTRTRTDAASVMIDSLENVMTGLGTARDKRTFTRTLRGNKIDVEELDVRFEENDLDHNIVAIPAEDMVREWIDLQGPAAEQLETRLDELNARTVMLEAIMWARLYGTSLILVGLTNQKAKVDKYGDVTGEPDLALPAQPGKVQWLQVFDRYEVGSVTLGPDGKIVSYSINIGTTTETVHASRVLRFDGDPMPRRQRDSAGGWGLPVLQRCKPAIDNLDSVMASVVVAAQQFSETVLFLDKFTELMAADAGGVNRRRIEMLNLMRSTFGMVTLDGNDKMLEVSRNFAGIPDVLDRATERVASAARMPVALLMGRSPAGLNATGDADLRWWYAHVGAMQEAKLRPVLMALIKAVAAGDGIDLVEEPVKLTFCPLWRPTQKELADTHLVQAQADTVYEQMGAVTADEVRASRFGATGYSVETTVNDDAAMDIPAGTDVDPRSLDENGDPIAPSGDVSADVQKTALNGAQIEGMKGIVADVAVGRIPRDAGVAQLAFTLQITEAEAEKLMGSAGTDRFTPAGGAPIV